MTQKVWYFIPNTDTRVIGTLIEYVDAELTTNGSSTMARIRRDSDGKIVRVPKTVLRFL